MSEVDKARVTPHESKTRPLPEPNLCSECGLSPWADIHTAAKRAQTAKANEVRRRKFLERKADEYAAALRELGYTVIAPGEAKHRARITLEELGYLITDCVGHDVSWGAREEESRIYYCEGGCKS